MHVYFQFKIIRAHPPQMLSLTRGDSCELTSSYIHKNIPWDLPTVPNKKGSVCIIQSSVNKCALIPCTRPLSPIAYLLAF